MARKDCVERHGIKTQFRPHQNLAGVVAGEFVCEVERSIVFTSSMSFEDVLFCREYAVLLDALLRGNPFAELFLFLRSRQIAYSEFTTTLFGNLREAAAEIQACFDEYRLSFVSERFDTEEETAAFVEQHVEDYRLGTIGGDLLKYSVKLWVEHFRALMEWLFDTLTGLRAWDEPSRSQIEALRRYLLLVYYDRWNEGGDSSVDAVFDYDVAAWSRSSEATSLYKFAGACEYSFKATSESLSTRKAIWQSFGFFLDEGGDVDHRPHESARLYLNRTKRTASLIRARPFLSQPDRRDILLQSADQATGETLQRPFRWS